MAMAMAAMLLSAYPKASSPPFHHHHHHHHVFCAGKVIVVSHFWELVRLNYDLNTSQG